MTNDKYLISENSLEEITRNLEKCTTDLRNLMNAGKSAGKSKHERGFTAEYEAFSNLKEGTKITIVKHDHLIDRSYINFAGETGIIRENSIHQKRLAYPTDQYDQYIYLLLDKHFEILDEWDNCLVWNIEEVLDKDNDYFNIESSEDYPTFVFVKEEV